MSSVQSISQEYSKVQILLHWIVVLLIGSQYLFKNFIASAWDTIRSGQDFAFHPLILLHVVGGSLILLIMVWRLVLRVRYKVAVSPNNEHVILKRISGVVHWAFYIVIIMMSLSGLTAWFGGVVLAAQVHNILKFVLLGLIALHILAVPFHHIVLKDPIIKRMLIKSKH